MIIIKESNLPDWQDTIMIEIRNILKNNRIYADIYDDTDFLGNDDAFVLCVEIENGDWKHEHKRADILITDTVNHYDNMEITKIGEETIGDSEDDTYSSIHKFHIIRYPDDNGFDFDDIEQLDIKFPKRESIKRKNRKSVKESIYTDNGFKNRAEYLQSLADDFGVDINTVKNLADMLGPEEDFDGLVSEVEDLSDEWGNDDEDIKEGLDWYLENYPYVITDEDREYMGGDFIEGWETLQSAQSRVLDLLTYWDSTDVNLYDVQNNEKITYKSKYIDYNKLKQFSYDEEGYTYPYVLFNGKVAGEQVAKKNREDALKMAEYKTSKIFESIKKSNSKSVKESINLDDYKFKFSTKDGYKIYSKFDKSLNKGLWAACKDEEEPFEISYEQARGFEPINPTDRVVQRKLKKALKKENIHSYNYTEKLSFANNIAEWVFDGNTDDIDNNLEELENLIGPLDMEDYESPESLADRLMSYDLDTLIYIDSELNINGFNESCNLEEDDKPYKRYMVKFTPYKNMFKFDYIDDYSDRSDYCFFDKNGYVNTDYSGISKNLFDKLYDKDMKPNKVYRIYTNTPHGEVLYYEEVPSHWFHL